MGLPNRYNGGGPLQGVVIVDAATGDPASIGGGATGPGTAASAQRVTYASDGSTVPVKAASYTPLGYQQISDATLTSSTAMTVPSGATVAIIQNNGTAAARFRIDGSTTAPTTTTGQRIVSGGTLTLDIGNAALNTTRFIREASSVILDISYYS